MQMILNIGVPVRAHHSLDYTKLPEALLPLGAGLRAVRGGYLAILQAHKQPSIANDYTKIVAQAAVSFSQALTALSATLSLAQSSNTRAVSRSSDAINSLWGVFARYSSEASRDKASVSQLRLLLEELDEWVIELRTQQTLL